MKPVFLDALWVKNRFLDLSRNQVGNRVGHVPQNFNYKAGINFSSPADSCHIVSELEMCWSVPYTWSPSYTTYFLRFAPMRGIYLLKNSWQVFFPWNLNKNLKNYSYVQILFRLFSRVNSLSRLWVTVHYLFFPFYQRPQRPGRPPRGPPLEPPLGGGGGRSHGLASSLLLAASPPALLTSRVCVAALIGRQLAGQPERGRYRYIWRWQFWILQFLHIESLTPRINTTVVCNTAVHLMYCRIHIYRN